MWSLRIVSEVFNPHFIKVSRKYPDCKGLKSFGRFPWYKFPCSLQFSHENPGDAFPFLGLTTQLTWTGREHPSQTWPDGPLFLLVWQNWEHTYDGESLELQTAEYLEEGRTNLEMPFILFFKESPHLCVRRKKNRSSAVSFSLGSFSN